jgi:hypothetical protein
MNVQKILKEAQKAQAKAALVQEKLAATELVGQAGNGLVEVTVNGHSEVLGIRIQPQAVDPEDVEALEDLVLVAIKTAQSQARARYEEEMNRELGSITGMMGGL